MVTIRGQVDGQETDNGTMPRIARLSDIRRRARDASPYHLTGYAERQNSALITPRLRLSSIRRQARQSSRTTSANQPIHMDGNIGIPPTASRGPITGSSSQSSRPTDTTPSTHPQAVPHIPTVATTTNVARRGRRPTRNCARNYVDTRSMAVHRLPQPKLCNKCGARLFAYETNEICCKNGKISLPQLQTPIELRMLYSDQTDVGNHFRQNIRVYNHMFAFTSMGVHYDPRLANATDGVFTFRAQGGIYHRIGGNIPTGPMPTPRPRYLQLYIYDGDQEIELRMLENIEMQVSMVRRLKSILDQHNPFVHQFRRLALRRDILSCKLVLKEQPLGGHQFNLPTADQVAGIIIGGEDLANANPRETIVETTEGTLQLIPDTIGYYDPLQYPLLLPYGNYGWDLNTRSLDGQRVGCRAFYSYMLQLRENDTSVILRAGRLLQQYIVDAYVKVEMQRLRWLRDNQKTIRAELYKGLQDLYSTGIRNAASTGRRIILPSSYVGSPRDMHNRYQSAMALVQRYGKPDLFITITCNPSWNEITTELLPGQQPQDRPDLTSRVFKAKLEELKTDLYTRGVLGTVVAHVHVVEFQKRGLPHAHMLIILSDQDKLNNPDEYDQVVRAEIPDTTVEPELYEIVKKHMIHGPCGRLKPTSPCMRNNFCKKSYPRQFSENTIQGNDSYPIYKRRDNGITVEKNGIPLDNRWVVPYNPWLLKKYNCHINVEICSSIKSVKYLYKYVYKGPDMISFQVCSASENNDEIKQFLDARWVGAQEAVWRIFKFPAHNIYPTVMALHIHLPNMQQLTYYADQLLDDVLDDANASKTMLTEFFQKNTEDPEARLILYREFPEKYWWVSGQRRWQRRLSTQRAVGRIYTVPPRETERYCLRILLNHVRGPVSFEDLLTVDGLLCSSFKESAEKRGLLEDDDHARKCLLEAAATHMPSTLRRLFATLLLHCQPTNVQQLWTEFIPHMMEDYSFTCGSDLQSARNRLVRDLNYLLQQHSRTTTDFGLPTPLADSSMGICGHQLLDTERSLIVTEEDLRCITQLNSGQQRAFDLIMEAINFNKESVFFIDGPGGTGKTFLYRAILAQLRNQGHIALAIASSGIAANILPGGRTAHSKFKIPIKITATSACNISKQDDLAAVLRNSSVIIWDEATMVHRHAFEAFDRTLRDLTDRNVPFGGKIVVLGGDFRQVLPVVQHGTKTQTIDACIVRSALWESVTVVRLTENMRSKNDPTFADFLKSVGDGVATTYGNDMVRIPDEMVIPWAGEHSITQLFDAIYPNMVDNANDKSYMVSRAIMAPTNESADAINQIAINSFPGANRVYYSFDSVEDDVRNLYQQEFLNSISPGGLPPHKLVLKSGAPILLLRNIDPAAGLCNGTRLLCRRFYDHFIDAEIITGISAGTRVFLPRIPLDPSENIRLPFRLIRKQFPVRLCFAMTINKAQGQTIPFAGIYLEDHVFSHGQLYVALSRGVSLSTTKIVIREGKLQGQEGTYAKNIVYKEVLLNY